MFYEKIIHELGSTFSHKVYPQFTMPWHYHPEYELIVITSGGGKRFVGDYMDDFKPGDLVLFGANLPHFHMCYGLLNNDPQNISSCEVIQFSKDLFPDKLDQIDEFSAVADLLQRNKRGIKFTNPPSIERICRIMRYMDRQSGVKRIAILFRILEMLAGMSEYKLLTSGDYSAEFMSNEDVDPVNRVYFYLINNFRDDISLEQLASYIGFNPSALCRYFKKHTQKSIFECLVEIRIGFACKLITNSLLTITQIAYESGYHNISNFNRQFKRLTNYSPSEYRELFGKLKSNHYPPRG